ncbi:hypothetical protein Taro_054216 [Colocasia esculenta]|uniref:non-specific serine/threonine protein kinase n=1 Tax=Colocasia esculenta TaxID=4460 RepID=A0A843XN48_COLES|nr:hypothetical protein [Colocasia esculenta]
MSDSAPPPASAAINGTSTGPSPALPTGGTPPVPDSESPPPSDSPPSPPVSSSDAASQPPSSLQQNVPPPPSLSPPLSNSVSPPVPQALNNPPSLPASPPPQAFNNSTSPLPIAPGQPASPSKNPPPTSQDSLPSTPPPVTSSPNPKNSPVTTPDTKIPLFTPPSQPLSPSVTEEPVVSPLLPTLPETTPSTSVPSSSTPATAEKATPSTTPDAKLPSSGSQLGPPLAHTSSSSSNQTPERSSGGLGNGTFVGITMAGALLLVLAIFFLTSRKKRRRRRTDSLGNHYGPPVTFSVRSDGYYGQVNQVGYSHDSDTHYAGNTAASHRGYPLESPGIGGSKSWFTYEEIVDMTQGFCRENLLGQGGFGCVYKGWLADGREVAVKQLKSGSGQGEREFRAEVEIISRVHHRHLVSLVGYSIADNQRSLVYEFVPNNTLEHHLHGRDLPVLDWPNRLKIAIGSARGLAYLHEDCHPRIIHRDIKSANILLDNSFEAQAHIDQLKLVADFGLAKLSNDTHTHVSTRVMGTFGYMAPEYASSGKLTDRSDVFSFGVVLLELITGRKPVDPSQPLGDESLVEWARPRLVHLLETGDFVELADPRLENNYIKSEMFRMIEAAAACVRHSASKRPRMVQVFRALDNEGELADLSNGVKFGQSTVFESRQYSADIQQFRRMAFGSLDSSSEYGPSGEYDRASSNYSSEHSSAETPFKPLNH